MLTGRRNDVPNTRCKLPESQWMVDVSSGAMDGPTVH